MVPLGDVVPRRTTPLVTRGVACILLLLVVGLHLLATPLERNTWFWAWGASPATLPWPAVVTALWLEPSWAVGSANIAALLLFGPAVEDRLGHGRFAALLGITAVAWVVLPVVMAGSLGMPVVGAAGPVAAVLAAYLVLFPRSKLVFWIPVVPGGSLHTFSILWAILIWVTVVTDGLARHAGIGPAGALQIISIAAMALAGLLGGRLLTRRERLLVSWWDIPARN